MKIKIKTFANKCFTFCSVNVFKLQLKQELSQPTSIFYLNEWELLPHPMFSSLFSQIEEIFFATKICY